MLNDVAINFLDELGITTKNEQPTLEILSNSNSKYLRDLKVNIKTALAAEELGERDALLIAYTISVTLKNQVLQESFRIKLVNIGASNDEIAEAASIASLLSANNVLYRFRHFSDNKKYVDLPARIRMNIMMSPVLGKELFELLSLAVSSVNGCEVCVKSHEHSVRELNVSEERIFAAIRVAAVIASADRIVS